MDQEAAAKAMNPLDELRQLAAEFVTTHESVSTELKVLFGALILRLLKKKAWKQKDLSEKSGIRESEISELVHGDANTTLETIGRVLHAFGVRGRILEVDPQLDEEIDAELAVALPQDSSIITTGMTNGTQTAFKWQESQQPSTLGQTTWKATPNQCRSGSSASVVGGHDEGRFPKRHAGRHLVVRHGVRGHRVLK